MRARLRVDCICANNHHKGIPLWDVGHFTNGQNHSSRVGPLRMLPALQYSVKRPRSYCNASVASGTPKLAVARPSAHLYDWLLTHPYVVLKDQILLA